jgi:hypothetical protein
MNYYNLYAELLLLKDILGDEYVNASKAYLDWILDEFHPSNYDTDELDTSDDEYDGEIE